MKHSFILKRFSVVALLAVFGVGLSYAGGNRYSSLKGIPDPTGAGIVYVGNTTYETGDENPVNNNENSQTHNYEISAVPEDGYFFIKWTGSNATIQDSNSENTTATVQTAEDEKLRTAAVVTAEFKKGINFYAKLNVEKSGEGSIEGETLKSVLAHPSSTSAEVTFSLKAVPSPGYIFQKWEAVDNVTIANTNEASTTIVVISQTQDSGDPSVGSVKAIFVQTNTYYAKVNATASPAGLGTVTGDVSTTKSATSQTSSAQIQFSLTAKPNDGNVFLGWSKSENSSEIFDKNVTTSITVKATSTTKDNPTTESYYALFASKVATPVISIDKSTDMATIECETENATIYYTTDGSEPTTSSTEYTKSFKVSEGMVVKAVATRTGFKDSDIATQTYSKAEPTGASDSVVTLNDLEDHNWTYYQQSSNLPSGYPTTYLSSPNPRNVKITYRAGGVDGASPVAISALEREGQNEMVYYKTLEKSVPGMSGDYPYTVISNPFSKRPATGSGNNKTYYGFAGWKIVDGGEYISEHDDSQTLGLDETIHFTNLDNNYTPNCMSAEIVFEATWTQATVKTGNSAPSFTGGTYETNFWVLTGNPNNAITVPTNCTMTARYPDGSVSWDGNFTRAITAGGNNAKVEFVNMNSTENISAANYTFTMGRGIVNSGNGGELRGCTNSNADCIQTVKVESGKYASLRHFTAGLSNARRCDQLMILGCDYDRAKIDNSKLQITGSMYLANSTTISRESGVLFARSNIKSGTFQKTITGTYSGTADQSYYFGCYGSNNRSAGHRYMLVEGGDIRGLCGGTDHTTDQQAGDPAFTLRIRGSENNPIINGIIYGAAENADCRGRRTMVLTGGTVKGWIAGGANGTASSGGTMTGATFVYVGGKANINSGGSQTVINRAVGGNVFAAGCGYGTNSSSGQVTLGTNVVVADDAYVERGVYGGGSYGYTTNTSNIYITGGRIGGVAGGVNGTSYSANIPGGVYGGACQNQGGTVNIYMTGGEVNGGLYGGSNNSGTIANNVTMQINGGQVGTSSKSANIHGGGYGKNTAVKGSIDMTLGIFGQETKGVEVWGDVYGGSALGYVNFSPTINNNQITGGNYTQNTYTNVTMNKATINGSLYGGALGDASTPANVYGPVEVKVRGGSVKATSVAGSGGVYGANNINGAPQRSVSVDIYGTDPAPAKGEYALYAVYGGGNQADYLYGNGYPTVTVHGCDNSIEYVYGGGNAAAVASTDVTIWGGDIIGNVFGGGNGTVKAANVNGDATTKIHGGTILNVYGGSNAAGTINGDINLTINSMKEEGSSDKQPCTMDIGSVYGGGNLADMNGNISVSLGCINHIKELYGGARNANIGTDTQNSNINLAITSGHFDRVFGGNNLGGAIKGSITVNIEETGCNPITIGELYGGGNLAAYSVYGYDAEGNYKESGTKLYDDPVVNILSFSSIGRVFGGGLGNKAVMVGSPTVNINEDVGTNANNTEWPYLGQTISYTDESSVTLPTRNSGAIGAIGTVFGGGNAAPVIGNTQVNIGTITGKADIRGNVYGGGNQAKVTGKTNVVIGE